MTKQEMLEHIQATEIAYVLEHGSRDDMVITLPTTWKPFIELPKEHFYSWRSGITEPEAVRVPGSAFTRALQAEMRGLIADLKQSLNKELYK